VWQKAHALTLAVYEVTAGFPREERYGLTSQLRRSSASVPANIAEGWGRESDADRARFLHIAMGSASEVQYHILLARDLKLLRPSEYDRLSLQITEVKRMLTSLARRLKADG